MPSSVESQILYTCKFIKNLRDFCESISNFLPEYKEKLDVFLVEYADKFSEEVKSMKGMKRSAFRKTKVGMYLANFQRMVEEYDLTNEKFEITKESITDGIDIHCGSCELYFLVYCEVDIYDVWGKANPLSKKAFMEFMKALYFYCKTIVEACGGIDKFKDGIVKPIKVVDRMDAYVNNAKRIVQTTMEGTNTDDKRKKEAVDTAALLMDDLKGVLTENGLNMASNASVQDSLVNIDIDKLAMGAKDVILNRLKKGEINTDPLKDIFTGFMDKLQIDTSNSDSQSDQEKLFNLLGSLKKLV
jgi:hypothetical protein